MVVHELFGFGTFAGRKGCHDAAMLVERLSGCPDYEANRNALHVRFDEMYAELARADERRCESSVNQRSVLTTAYYLFDRKRSDALRELGDFVRGKADGSFAATLLPLLEGLLAELEGTPQLALERFEEVAVGEDKSLVELALMQIHDLARGLVYRLAWDRVHLDAKREAGDPEEDRQQVEEQRAIVAGVEHRAGDISREADGISHYWINHGREPAVLLSSDVFHKP